MKMFVDDRFRQYLQTTIISEKVLRTGIQKNTLSKILSNKYRSAILQRRGANRQFSFLEISLVYDKVINIKLFTIAITLSMMH